MQHLTHIPTNDPAIARLIARGASEHPGITEPPGLRVLLASCIAHGARNLEARAADLYIASACVAEDLAALASLDAQS